MGWCREPEYPEKNTYPKKVNLQSFLHKLGMKEQFLSINFEVARLFRPPIEPPVFHTVATQKRCLDMI